MSARPMDELNLGGQVQLWPVLMGWILICCMYLFSWKRQALIASLGMTIVTLFVLAAYRAQR